MKKFKRRKADAAVLAYHKKSTSVQTDVLGSYTGNAQIDPRPSQDADDL